MPRTPARQGHVELVEVILSFSSVNNYDAKWPHLGRCERAFGRCDASLQQAVRKHWLIDHCPRYASFIGIELDESEQRHAAYFWERVEADRLERQSQPRRRRRRHSLVAA